ncbi:hypothetical protein SLA2020_483540 [Shorea laevis]
MKNVSWRERQRKRLQGLLAVERKRKSPLAFVQVYGSGQEWNPLPLVRVADRGERTFSSGKREPSGEKERVKLLWLTVTGDRRR